MAIQIYQMFDSVRTKFHIKLRLVGLVAITIFFLGVFNSIMAYLAPNIMLDSGMSELKMGLIYSTSSIFGVIFDFILAKYLSTTHYKRMLLYTILIAALFPLTMLIYPTVTFFVLGMLVWGLYSNLWGFAYYDFAAREAKIAFHATSLSLLFIFLDLGDFIGTLLAEPVSHIEGDHLIAVLLIAILCLSLLSLVLSYFIKGNTSEAKKEPEPMGNIAKMFRVSKKLLPLLIFGTLLNIIEAVLWTVTPIVERVAPQIENYGGVLLAVTIIPSFFTNIAMQKISTKHGKKRIAIISFILGCLLMAGLGFTTSLFAYFTLTFLYAVCFAIVYPMLGGAYADYLQESNSYDNEILGSKDMFANLGYIIGPALGTWILSMTNSLKVFTYLGLGCAILALVIFLLTPKNIPFRDSNLKINN